MKFRNKEERLLDAILDKVREEDMILFYSQARVKGVITAERMQSPVKHRLHAFSVGKAVTACAVGIAEKEGLLSLDDPVIDYFEEYKTYKRPMDTYGFTIRDTLKMSIGLKDALFFSTDKLRYEAKDWVDFFWNAEFDASLKGRFLYSNFDSYILSCLIERVSGQNMLEYLRYRFFEPIGIKNPDWTCCPKGHTYACNGIYLNIDEMGTLGELLLNGGKWGDDQIVPEKFIKEATSKQIDTVGNPFGERLYHGYGYGIWMSAIPGAYVCYGSCGQFILCIPDRKLVLSFLTFEPKDHLRILDIITEKTINYLKG